MTKEIVTEEVEITPEMLEAGYRVLLKSGITDAQVEADKLVVAEIFRVMATLDPLRASAPESNEVRA